MSDDDRMSLTTAVSDDDEIEESMNNNGNGSSPYKMAKQSGGSAASFNCTGAVRKAGFLSVKKWILRKKHQVKEHALRATYLGIAVTHFIFFLTPVEENKLFPILYLTLFLRLSWHGSEVGKDIGFA